MKKINLAVSFVVAIFTAIPLMAQNQSIEELKTENQKIVQANIDQQSKENVIHDLEAIKELNTKHNNFLDFLKHSKNLRYYEDTYAAQKIIMETDDLGKAVIAINDPTVKNIYAETIKLAKYYFEYTNKHTSIEKLASYSYSGGGLMYFPGAEFLASREVVAKEIANNEVIKDLNTRHTNFINFLINSENLRGETDTVIAQNVIREVRTLAEAVDDLDDGSFKDHYIETLNSIKYYCAYEDRIVTLKEIVEFADESARGILFPEGTHRVQDSIRVLLPKNIRIKLKIEDSLSSPSRFWEVIDGAIETFQHEK